jgi:hypothetical protein
MEVEFQRELDKLSKAESEASSFWQAKCAGLVHDLAAAEAELLRREAERSDLRAGWEAAARRDLRERDDEIRDLKRQIRGLKEWVSTSTRSDEQAQTSDEVFGYEMARLGNSLQNWVLVNLRRAKIGEAFFSICRGGGPWGWENEVSQ